MRGNAHEAKHPEIVSDVQDLAEMVQRIARKSVFCQELLDLLPGSEKSFSRKSASKIQ
jgi:hypothetical protein